MDHHKSSSNNIEDNVGIPEDLRCKRSDGKQWRCTALSMPDKTVCEKHYIQAKKRAANSALRASLKKVKRKSPDDPDVYLERKKDELDTPLPSTKEGMDYIGSSKKSSKRHLSTSPDAHVKGSSTSKHQKFTEKTQKDVGMEDCNRLKFVYKSGTSGSSSRSRSQKSLMRKAFMDYSVRSTDSSGEASGQSCHQCRRNDKGRVIWCLGCEGKVYCTGCISKWYPDLTEEDIQKACPVCRGNCNCRICLSGDNLVKVKIREISAKDKLHYLHHLLSFVLPVLKQIHHDQSFEMDIEKKLHGTVELPRVRLSADDKLCCDCCGMPIIDYHRHCTSCAFDLCLNCCQDLRKISQLGDGKEVPKEILANKGKEEDSKQEPPDQLGTVAKQSHFDRGNHVVDFSHLFPDWTLNDDGSIPCPSTECGGSDHQSLGLQRVFKQNWLVKLQKVAEEIVGGCKINSIEDSVSCTACLAGRMHKPNKLDLQVSESAKKNDQRDKVVYCPSYQDINSECFHHFQKHWLKGEPIVVRDVFSSSSASCWNPVDIWQGIRETTYEKLKDGNRLVKAIDCLDWSEVEIELGQFFKGYSEGRIHENGWPQMLKLKDWPAVQALEEFLLYQRAEFISSLPLLEYVHSKWGVLNLASKLPSASPGDNFDPKVSISYGTYEELGRGDSVTNLHVNIDDAVHLLMHTSEVKFQGWQRAKIEKIQKTFKAMDVKDNFGEGKPFEASESQNENGKLIDHETSEQAKLNGNASYLNEKGAESTDERASRGDKASSSERIDTVKHHAGVHWEVFRRQDVARLNEYLKLHWKEFRNRGVLSNDAITHPLYDQTFFLSEDHKRKLKEEFNVEPWIFEQHVGEAVFVPAGCAFQVRNLQSTVHLSLEFLSPESLSETVSLSQEIRCLPKDHETKKHALEVGKMALYATSWSVREIKKLVVDPGFDSDIRVEDRNLTSLVLENLEKIKQRQIACS